MKKLALLTAALTGALFLAGCGGGGDDGAQVATSNAVAPINATTGQQATTPILNQDFTFSSGIPELGTATPTTLTFKPRTQTTLPDNRAPASNPEFTIQSGTDIAGGLVAFGSCKFIFTSKFRSIEPGTTIEIPECDVNYDTAGKPVFVPQSVNVTLTLGKGHSQPKTITVTIDASGTVTVNGLGTGAKATVGFVTGS